MKKILILYSQYTGHGHKSIADSLMEQFAKMEDVRFELVDGFSLIGRVGIQASKAYGPMTRRARDLWKKTYDLSNQRSKALEYVISTLIHDRFMRMLSAFTPDLIVTVHSMFNSSVINLLETYELDIPFVVLQADIINIHNTWCDPRATLTLCPTKEAWEKSLDHGMPEEKLRIVGFPTRARFCEAARRGDRAPYDGRRPVRCLLMSGGEGSGNLLRYAEHLLRSIDCHISIICGRNRRMRETLEDELLPAYEDRVSIYGFVDNVEDIMLDNDLLIARGSPNTMMEAVVLQVPLVITGSLPGQEQDNPALMVSHNLGVVCETPEAAPAVITALTRDGGRRLRDIQASQRAYRNLDNAKEIAALLYGLAPQAERALPEFKARFPAPAPTSAATRYTIRRAERMYSRGEPKG